jgi:hypothetical protein
MSMMKALHSTTRSHLAFLILKVAIFYSSSVLSSLKSSIDRTDTLLIHARIDAVVARQEQA